LSWLDSHLKRWQFISLMSVATYAVAAGAMWLSYPATPTERQVGSRAFSALLFLPLVLLVSFGLWGVVCLIAKRGDKRQRT
jgi:hypothetical protein